MNQNVALLIPVWNGRLFIPPLLDSIINLNYPKNNLHVLIADNGSTDDSLAIINEYSRILNYNQIENKVIRIGKNMGVPYAYNVLLDNSPSDMEYILRLDQDVILERHSLIEMIRAFGLFEGAGVVGPKFLDYRGERIVHGPGLLSQWSLKPYQGNPHLPRECDWLHGAAMMIKSRFFYKHSLRFNENYFLFFDDTDLCFRIHRLGYKIIYWPHAVVRHAVSTLTEKRNPVRAYYYLRGRIYFTLKYGSLIQKMVYLIPYYGLGCHVAAFTAALKKEAGIGRVIYRALFDAITGRWGKQM